jgi:hypothetical protein
LKRIGIALDSCIYRQRVGLKDEMALPDCVRFPWTFFTSLGFTEAAMILIFALPRVTIGSGTDSTLRFSKVLLNEVM